MAGNITIIEPKDHFQKVSKDIIYNKEIGVLTLGIYVKVLCLGKKWKLSVRGLAKMVGVSTDKIRASFAELEKAGYLRRSRAHGKNGKFSGWDYAISSESLTDMPKTPTSVNTDDVEKPTLGKQASIDRDMVISNEDYTSKTEKKEFRPPTRSEIVNYVLSRGWMDPEGFADFYLAHHQMSGWITKNGRQITNWEKNILSWEPFNKTRFFSRTVSENSSTQYHEMNENEFVNSLK